MTDNITLPRELAEKALEALEHCKLVFGGYSEEVKALRTHLAAEQPKHPGYVIGSHWLETAYSRICAGEAEADVLRDIGLVREEAFLTGVAHLKAENERLREALESIAANACCDKCQEAALVARAALRREDKR